MAHAKCVQCPSVRADRGEGAESLTSVHTAFGRPVSSEGVPTSQERIERVPLHARYKINIPQQLVVGIWQYRQPSTERSVFALPNECFLHAGDDTRAPDNLQNR